LVSHREEPKGTPILDFYNSEDAFVVGKHVDWSTGHGIGFWLASWGGPGSDMQIRQIFANSLIQDVKIGILYESTARLRSKPPPNRPDEENYDLSDKANIDILTSDVSHLTDSFFVFPQYVKSKGSPIIFFYYSRSYTGDIQHTMGLIRDTAQDNGCRIFIIGDEVFWDSPNSVSIERFRPYDAITQYSMHPTAGLGVTDSNYETMLDSAFAEWSSRASDAGVKFILMATPGRTTTHSPDAYLTRDRFRFARRLRIATDHMGPELRTIMITSFNEWFEGTNVEPSVEDGFEYPQTIRDTLAQH